MQASGNTRESLEVLKQAFKFLSNESSDADNFITMDSVVVNYWTETLLFTYIMTLASLS
jgi:hypothetical protein